LNIGLSYTYAANDKNSGQNDGTISLKNKIALAFFGYIKTASGKQYTQCGFKGKAQ
jgi:hypothetical protein